MKELILKHKKWLGYTVYCLILAAVFLYTLFPSEAIMASIQSRAEKIHPDIHVTTRRLVLSFPPGIKTYNTEVSLGQNPGQPVFKANRVSLRPVIWSLLKKSSDYHFHCKAYGGSLKGSADISDEDSGTFLSTSMEFEDLHIGGNSPISSFISDRFEGTIEGTFDYLKEADKPLTEGSGEAVLTMSDCLIKLSDPVLTLDTIDFNEILLRISLGDRAISLSSAEFKGNKMKGTASGTMYIKRDFMESRLDFQGEMEPAAALFQGMPGAADMVAFIKNSLKNGKLPFTLEGTLKNPRINFI